MFTTLLLALLPLQDATAAEPTGVQPDFEGYRYQGALPVGRVYHYRKSNIDGTHASRVDLYMSSEKRIEAFKYSAGSSEGTLVIADMDWKTFSVGHFETAKVHANGERAFVGELNVKGDTLHGKFGGGSFKLEVEQFPWHNYDFDFASLNVTFRHLADPEGVVWFGIIDRPVGGAGLANRGMVELAYLGEEEREKQLCRHYWIDGPGLYERGGDIWVRKGDDPVIVDYEIDLPDERPYKSGKMTLLGTEEMSAEAWAKHMLSKLR